MCIYKIYPPYLYVEMSLSRSLFISAHLSDDQVQNNWQKKNRARAGRSVGQNSTTIKQKDPILIIYRKLSLIFLFVYNIQYSRFISKAQAWYSSFISKAHTWMIMSRENDVNKRNVQVINGFNISHQWQCLLANLKLYTQSHC